MPLPPVRASSQPATPPPAGPWARAAYELADYTEASANDLFDTIATVLARRHRRRRHPGDLEEIWAAAHRVVDAAVAVRGLARRLTIAETAHWPPCHCPDCHRTHPYTPE